MIDRFHIFIYKELKKLKELEELKELKATSDSFSSNSLFKDTIFLEKTQSLNNI